MNRLPLIRNPQSAIRNGLLLLLATVLSGCSSGGGKLGGGGAQQDQAAQNLSTVVVMRKWVQVLYPQTLVAAPSTPCRFQQSRPVRQPDGSFVQETTFDNCVKQKATQFPDGTSKLERQFPDGSSETATLGRSQRSGNIISQQVTHTYPNSGPMSYRITRDTRGTATNQFDDTSTLDGQIELASAGQNPVKFTIQRANRVDQIKATLSDGAQFAMTVPLRPSSGAFIPDFNAVTSGSFATGGGRVEFELRGTGATNFNDYTLRAPGGVTGRFALNRDFTGTGQFFRNGQLDSTVIINPDGSATVTLVGGEATTAGPSAAALAFLAHAWRELVGLVGPAPGAR